MSMNSLNNKPADVVHAWKETIKLAKKLKAKLDPQATIECSICGSVLIGDETICNDCKDVLRIRPAPLPPISPYE